MSLKLAKLAMVTNIDNNTIIYDCSSSKENINNNGNIKVAEETTVKLANYVCDVCEYYTHKKYNYELHLLTIKHTENIATMNNNKNYKYNCNICDYHTNKKYNYEKHMRSIKHDKKYNKNKQNIDIDNSKDNTISLSNELINDDTLSSIMSEIKILMVEQNKMNKMITDIANKPTNNISNTLNNNQTNNQQFNLNMFLNETCKDAMNLSEFIENIHVSMEDMEKTGELGFAKGMSRIIMNNLNAIDVCKRPIHCSDVKRETLYVKNNGVWEKETDERNKTKEIIYKVSQLNLKHLLKWRDLPRNKGYEKSDHVKNDEFTNLVIEINKMREEEFDKIITSVSKHVAIDKEKVKMSGYLN
jgi:hypothetical protein